APGPPGFHAGQRVLENRGRPRLQTEGSGPGQEGVRSWLSAQVLALGDDAIDPRLEQVLDARGREHLLGVGAGRYDGAAQARVPASLDVADRALVYLRRVLAYPPQQDYVLAVAEAVDRFRAGWVVVAAFGQLDPPGGEERPDPIGPRFPVHVLLVVPARVERYERLAGPTGTVPQVVVEHLFPRGVVHERRLGDDAIQVEQAPADALGETKHASSVRAGEQQDYEVPPKDAKKVRMSWTSRSGASSAAKWPPVSKSLQCTMLLACSA